jgi:hypothetical protein
MIMARCVCVCVCLLCVYVCVCVWMCRCECKVNNVYVAECKIVGVECKSVGISRRHQCGCEVRCKSHKKWGVLEVEN